MLELLFRILSAFNYLALNVKAGGSFPPPLSADEEKRFLALAEAGDPEAKNKLVEHNLRLVAHIVKKYGGTGDDADDLISIGTVGLIKAVSTFRSDKNIRLATYAARCIENEILMHFRSLKKTAQDVSFSEPIDTDRDGNALTLMDVVSDGSDVIDKIDLKIKSERLKVLIFSLLDEREREIVILRYGLAGSRDLTQRAIAERLGISRSYVSRIEKSALKKLKKHLE